MSFGNFHNPLVDRFYLRYLEDENSANFIAAVSEQYMVSSLERLAEFGTTLSRRGALLALGFLAGMESNPVLGRALKDPDEGVRVLAENAIREMWCRDGNIAQRHELAIIIRLNNALRFNEVIDRATRLIAQTPRFSEVWNQRAIALYQLRRFEEAASDCQETIDLNPFHFGAIVGMAHCYLELGQGFAALDCFRQAVEINPNLEAVRGQIEYLQRALEET